MTPAKSAEVRRILDRYIAEVVVTYNLCPWARNAALAVEIVWGAPAPDAWVAAAKRALAPGISVAMIVAPELAIDREALRGLRDEVAARLPAVGIAEFHPDAPLDLASPARLVPFARRAPDPLLQCVPLALLEATRTTALADRSHQAAMLSGHAEAPHEDVATRIARTNHETVTVHAARVIDTLDSIAIDRRAAYRRVGISTSR